MSPSDLLQQGLNAIQLGSMYALIALGYTMVYGVLSMINFAHGDFFMLGAFGCLIGSSVLGLPFPVVLVLTMAAVALLGALVERLAYKPLRNAPRVSAIITALGVGIFLENVILAICPYPQHISPLLPDRSFHLGTVTLSLVQVIIIGLSLTLMVGLHLFVKRTKTGLAMRAISVDRSSVALMGVNVDRIITLTFLLGSALGGAAGVLYGMAYPVIDPFIGVMVGWKAFIAAVIGGIGDIRGAVLGAFLLAAVEVLTASLLPSTFRDFIAFSLLIVLLILRPYGLLGKPTVQKV